MRKISHIKTYRSDMDIFFEDGNGSYNYSFDGEAGIYTRDEREDIVTGIAELIGISEEDADKVQSIVENRIAGYYKEDT